MMRRAVASSAGIIGRARLGAISFFDFVEFVHDPLKYAQSTNRVPRASIRRFLASPQSTTQSADYFAFKTLANSWLIHFSTRASVRKL